jgi:hypothetical protein
MKSLSNRGSDPTQLLIHHRANNLLLDFDQRLHPGVLPSVCLLRDKMLNFL